MAEWRLFPEGTVPAFTQPDFFRRHGWVPPEAQTGHRERVAMVAAMVAELDVLEVVDLGAGDGSLLAAVTELRPEITAYGYDLGDGNRQRAGAVGRDVRLGDIVADLEELLAGVDEAAAVVCTEVVEHLLDPHTFVARLAAASAGRVVVLSSPSSETDVDHYEHHAWAWDLAGYRHLAEGAGFRVLDQRTAAAAGSALTFQAISLLEVRGG